MNMTPPPKKGGLEDDYSCWLSNKNAAQRKPTLDGGSFKPLKIFIQPPPRFKLSLDQKTGTL